MPLGLSCGTGHRINAGHSSKLEGSIDINDEYIKLDLEPLLPTTEIISIKYVSIYFTTKVFVVVNCAKQIRLNGLPFLSGNY